MRSPQAGRDLMLSSIMLYVKIKIPHLANQKNRNQQPWIKGDTVDGPWMVEKILHQLVDGVFHYNPSTYSVS